MYEYPYTLNEKQLKLAKKMLEWLKSERDASVDGGKYYDEIRKLKRIIIKKGYFKNEQRLLNEIRELYILHNIYELFERKQNQ